MAAIDCLLLTSESFSESEMQLDSLTPASMEDVGMGASSMSDESLLCEECQ